MLRELIVVLLLLLTSTTTLVNVSEDKSEVIVPEDAASINQAISIAASNGVVRVRSGVYTEYVYLNKSSVELIGEGMPRLLESVTIDSVSYATVRGMSIEIYPPGTDAGISILNSSNVVLENLLLKGSGILIADSVNVLIRNCSFTENPGPAIRITGKGSKDIVIEGSVFNDTYIALSVHQGVNITFRYNIVYADRLSVKLYSDCRDSRIYMNNFIKGGAEDNGLNNKWYSPELKLGNLWGEPYTCIDMNGDGISDEPVELAGTAGAIDPYPLVKQFSEYLNSISQESKDRYTTAIFIALLLAAAVVVAALAYLHRKGV